MGRKGAIGLSEVGRKGAGVVDQHRIACVVAVARCGSITRAAAEVYSSPQHVKDEVDAAERELGCPLFVRSSKGCVPTRAGEAFLDGGPSMLHQLEAFCAAVARAGAVRREIRIQSWENKEIPVLDAICDRFARAYPDVALSFVNTTVADMYADIAGGLADIGFFARSDVDGAGAGRLEHRVCKGLVMGYRCVVAATDGLAGRPQLVFDDLQGRSVALCSAAIPGEFDGKRIDLLLPWERYAVLNHCASGGVCIVDEYFDVRGPNVAQVPLAGLSVQIYSLFRPDPPLHLRRFMDVVDEVCKPTGRGSTTGNPP